MRIKTYTFSTFIMLASMALCFHLFTGKYILESKNFQIFALTLDVIFLLLGVRTVWPALIIEVDENGIVVKRFRKCLLIIRWEQVCGIGTFPVERGGIMVYLSVSPAETVRSMLYDKNGRRKHHDLIRWKYEMNYVIGRRGFSISDSTQRPLLCLCVENKISANYRVCRLIQYSKRHAELHGIEHARFFCF